MSDLMYAEGDATYPIGKLPVIIAHIVNNIGVWGGGFTRSLTYRWPKTRSDYLMWHTGNTGISFELGEVYYTKIDYDYTVAHMLAQYGIRTADRQQPVEYPALEESLTLVGEAALDAIAYGRPTSVHMPRIGCGLGGGSWAEVEPIIQRTLVDRGVDVTVYDYTPAHWGPR